MDSKIAICIGWKSTQGCCFRDQNMPPLNQFIYSIEGVSQSDYKPLLPNKLYKHLILFNRLMYATRFD